MTPQQMRELAEGRRTWMWHGDWDEEAEIALRTAADQLEAVQRLTDVTPVMVHPTTHQIVDVVFAADITRVLGTPIKDGRDARDE